MWIRVGTLKLIRSSKELHHVLVQFWGEECPARLETTHDLSYNSERRLQEYDIKAPIIFFVKYLEDMKRNLKLEVQGIGHVVLDMSKFLKKQVQITDRYVFDHFKGAFEVQGKQNRKMGSLQIEMASNFNPEIAIRQLGQNYQVQRQCLCAVRDVNQCPCNQDCSCHCDLKRAMDVLVVQKSKKIKEFSEEIGDKSQQKQTNSQRKQVADQRIPNSLNIKPKEDRQFDPSKYSNDVQQIKQQKKPSVNRQNRNIKRLAKESEANTQMHANRMSQVNYPQQISMQQRFPAVQKILTYDDLRIDKPPQDVSNLQQPLNLNLGRNSERQDKKPYLEGAQAGKKHKQNFRIATPQKGEEKALIDEFYSGQAGSFGGRVFERPHNQLDQQEEIESHDQSAFLPQTDQQISPPKPILQRVVNLNQQLARQQMEVPVTFTQQPQEKHHIRLPKVQNYFHSLGQQKGPMSPIKIKAQKLNQVNRPFIGVQRQNKEQMNQMNRPPGRSSLLLNMLTKIYTRTMDLKCDSGKIEIVYRPYGQKQRVKVGPSFNDPFLICCPISVSQLIKMKQLPFIMEFWEYTTNKFLGVVKIDLKKVYKGFIFQGRVNQMAIKTSLMPTTINQGPIPIQNLQGNNIGSISLYAGIGTASQIDVYQNKKTEPTNLKPANLVERVNQQGKGDKRHPIKDQFPNTIQNLKPSLQKLDQLMEFIQEHNKQIFHRLLQSQGSSQQLVNFTQFINSLPKESTKGSQPRNSRQEFCCLECVFDDHPGSTLSKISKSYDSYKQVLRVSELELQKNIKKIRGKSNEATYQQIHKNSTFNVISKSQLTQILIQQVGCEKEVRLLMKGLKGNLINVDECVELLKSKQRSFKISLMISRQLIQSITESIVSDLFFKQCKVSSTNVMKMFGEVVCPITVQQLRDFFAHCNIELSIWLALHFIDIVKRQFQDSDQYFDQLSFITLYNWFIVAEKKFKASQEILEQKKKLKDNFPEGEISAERKDIKQKENSISESNIMAIVQHNDKKQSNRNEQYRNQEGDQIIKQQEIKEVEKDKQQQSQQKQEHIGPEKDKVYSHTFVIEPLQLSIVNAISGDCVISYCFPFENEWINSKSLSLFSDKHKYALKMGGKHSFTIHQPISDYLGDNSVKFTVRVNNKVQLLGAAHPDQLLVSKEDGLPEKPRSSEINVIPLYGQDAQSMAGKLKYRVTYFVEETRQDVLSKETTYNLFLPKSGCLNYLIHCKAQARKIRQQVNIRQEFYLVIVLDLFWESTHLRSHFPPISSKLYSVQSHHSDSKIQLAGGIKLVLNPVILQYIKNKTAKVSLNVVYYSKEKASYQRKEVSFATMTIPLIQVIKKNGIEGDYAFKNKLGMFSALASCILSYDKNLRVVEAQPQQIGLHKRDSYWLLFHFLQFINFQTSDYNSLKCEFVHHGKKYSTQKINLRGQTYHEMEDASILLHLNEESFQDLKVIPLSLVLGVQKFAVDIDINNLAKNLGREKYNVGNQYFIVIDQSGQNRRMRLGLKVYLFRGGNTIASFVDTIHRNLHSDVLSQMNLPAEIENHTKMLSIMKKNLKMVGKSFDQAVQELLPRKNDQFPLQFLSNQPYCKLDFTPIFIDDGSMIQNLCEDLPTEIESEQLLKYIKANQIGMTNLRPEFLNRYTFSALNKNGNGRGLDKNVDYLGLNSEVDLITFIRKLKVVPNQHQQSINKGQIPAMREKQIQITIIQGHSFHYLYNGIKPNVFLVLPQLHYRSNTYSRTADPTFNESIRQILDQKRLNQLKKLKFEVYHQDSPQEILIGEGTLILKDILNRNLTANANNQSFRVALDSVMSRKMQATLEVKIQIRQLQEQDPGQGNIQDSAISDDIDNSRDLSRIGNVIKGYRDQMRDREDIFQSSDDDY